MSLGEPWNANDEISSSSSSSSSMPSSSSMASSSSSSMPSSSSMASSSSSSMPSSSSMASSSSSSLSMPSSSSSMPSSSLKKKSEIKQLAFKTVDLDIILDQEDDVEKGLKACHDMRVKELDETLQQSSTKATEEGLVHMSGKKVVEMMNSEEMVHTKVSEVIKHSLDLEGDLEEEGKEEEGQCRVCHLLFDVELGTSETIQLGCHCKHDLGIAHQNCAEAWFKIKGNRICEICGATAENIVGNENSNFMEQWNDADADAENRTESHARCWQSLSLCNFFLACMVVTFILLWLFRVTIS